MSRGEEEEMENKREGERECEGDELRRCPERKSVKTS